MERNKTFKNKRSRNGKVGFGKGNLDKIEGFNLIRKYKPR